MLKWIPKIIKFMSKFDDSRVMDGMVDECVNLIPNVCIEVEKYLISVPV